MQIKVSDAIADFLKEKEIKCVFGIIGAGNAHIYDSISTLGFTEIVCVHHEQAAIMAAIAYFRTSGKPTACLLTTGAGSTNGVTGVVSAWMDSIPCLIISGNENSKYTRTENKLRIWGVQGYDSVKMVESVTKYSSRVLDAGNTIKELETALQIAMSQRPGPVWIDIPMDIQSSSIASENISRMVQVDEVTSDRNALNSVIDEVYGKLLGAKRPLIWLGHGIRLAGAADLIAPIISKLGVPYLVSWAGIDLADSNDPLNCGRAGVYGQRSSNFILQNCDFLLTIGTRLAIPQIGYDISELARDAQIVVVDIDELEGSKYSQRIQKFIKSDAKEFLVALDSKASSSKIATNCSDWIAICAQLKTDFPTVGPEHADKNGFINSYRFMDKLVNWFSKDQIVVTDMGTALLSGHQVLRFSRGQRLLTSTGLGEMGFGLPAAVGASFATNRGSVLCLNCDGGMLLNLQELQTIAHHQLPIKIVVFNNDGYLMIKHTQKSLFKGRYAGTHKSSGVSCPDYSKIGSAFNMKTFQIRTWKDFDEIMPEFMELATPAICEVFMDPEQPLVPKLSLAMNADGSLVSPPLEDLFPFIDRKSLKKAMLGKLHSKSIKIEVKA